LTTTPDPKIIFIILIITLNLHDLSLSEFGCNTRPNSLGCGYEEKKTNEEKEKKSELTGLTRQT